MPELSGVILVAVALAACAVVKVIAPGDATVVVALLVPGVILTPLIVPLVITAALESTFDTDTPPLINPFAPGVSESSKASPGTLCQSPTYHVPLEVTVIEMVEDEEFAALKVLLDVTHPL